MRLLFIFSGLLRTIETNINNINKLLDGKINYDIYIHYTINEEEKKYNNIQFKKNFDIKNIKKIVSENIDEMIFNFYKNDKELNTAKQWYKIYQIFKLIPKNTYDFIIRIRSDLFIMETCDYLLYLFDNLKNDILYIPFNNDIYNKNIFNTIGFYNSINDQFAIGSYNIMKLYSKLYINLNKYNNLPFISEIILYQYLKDNNIKFERINLNYKLLLSTCNIIAISGDSGVGKTTLLKAIETIFCFNDFLKFETDRYHKWERGNENWNNYTHLNPSANYLEKLCDDTYNFKIGNDIITVDYDHTTGKFTEKYNQEVKDNIILCGLHTLYSEHIRNIIDIKIYIDTDINLKKYWKIKRDVYERGYDINKVLTTIENRQNDFINFIDIQKQYANIIIRYYIENENYNDIKFEILLDNQYYLDNNTKFPDFFKFEKKNNFKKILLLNTDDFNNYNIYNIIIQYIQEKNLSFISNNNICSNGLGLLQLLLISLIYN